MGASQSRGVKCRRRIIKHDLFGIYDFLHIISVTKFASFLSKCFETNTVSSFTLTKIKV